MRTIESVNIEELKEKIKIALQLNKELADIGIYSTAHNGQLQSSHWLIAELIKQNNLMYTVSPFQVQGSTCKFEVTITTQGFPIFALFTERELEESGLREE